MMQTLQSPVSTHNQARTSLVRDAPVTAFNSSSPFKSDPNNAPRQNPPIFNPFKIATGPGIFAGIFLNLGILYSALYCLDAICKDKIKPVGGLKKTFYENESDEFGPFKALTGSILQGSFKYFVINGYGMSNQLGQDEYVSLMWKKPNNSPSPSPSGARLNQSQPMLV